MKTYKLSEAENLLIGKKGTIERAEYESELKFQLNNKLDEKRKNL